MNDIVIKIQNVSKKYKLYDRHIDRLKESLNLLKKKYHHEFQALKNINLEIKKGETVGILGPNGAGKSTLLKIITGVLTQTHGIVSVTGKIASLLELGAGFNPEMTGMENIYLNGTIMGFSTKEMDEKLDEIIEFADIGEFIGQPVKLYSSGMFARLAFSVSVNVEPRVLIVDEVLSVGDSRFQRKCFARMEHMRDQGITIIFVSHAEGLINEICTRAVLMKQGEIVIDGSPKNVTSLYKKYNNQKTNWNIELLKGEFEKIEKNEIKQRQSEGNEYKERNDINNENIDLSIIPNNPIYYDKDGARIVDPKIKTNDGVCTNILEQGKEYIYSYIVIIEHDIKKINFGMLIKTINGLHLGGGTFPGKEQYHSEIKKGKYEVKWRFNVTMNEATYFLNAGVYVKLETGESKFIARSLDHFAFRVKQSNSMATGHVDFLQDCSIREL